MLFCNSDATISANRYFFGVTNFAGGTLGERIFRLRQHLGSTRKPLALAALAERLNTLAVAAGGEPRYYAATLQRWEVGPAEPDLGTLRFLAQLAGIPVYDFAYGEPEPPDVADDPPAVVPVTRPTPPNPGLIIQPGPSVALPDPSVTRPQPKRRAGGR
jgi:transcriptional regulator with XRE-family HTH domain